MNEEPKNCKCVCHKKEPKVVKRPPHVWSTGFKFTYKGKSEFVQVCTVCRKEKREVVNR